MSAKVVFFFCAQALFVQLALSSCIGRPNLGAGLVSYGLSSPIAPGLGLSPCAGPVYLAPVLPTPDCSSLGYNGIGYGYGNAGLGFGPGLGVIPTTGGALPLSSSSSVTPTGLSIVSENVFEGNLYVDGELPFASAVALEGELPSGGAGVVSHSCGNGVTAVESSTPSAAAAAVPAGIGAYGAGLPLSLLPGAGCNGLVAEIVAPIDGCYPPGIFF